jgi:hypothetical protein
MLSVLEVIILSRLSALEVAGALQLTHYKEQVARRVVVGMARMACYKGMESTMRCPQKSGNRACLDVAVMIQ